MKERLWKNRKGRVGCGGQGLGRRPPVHSLCVLRMLEAIAGGVQSAAAAALQPPKRRMLWPDTPSQQLYTDAYVQEFSIGWTKRASPTRRPCQRRQSLPTAPPSTAGLRPAAAARAHARQAAPGASSAAARHLPPKSCLSSWPAAPGDNHALLTLCI